MIVDDVPDFERTHAVTSKNTESPVAVARYNLRGHRSAWKDKYNRQAFHMNARITRMYVFKKELKRMIEKLVWIPVTRTT